MFQSERTDNRMIHAMMRRFRLPGIGRMAPRRSARNRDEVYAKNFRLLAFTIFVLILIVALPLSWSFEKSARAIVFADAADLLTQTGREVSLLVDTGQKLAIQIYYDSIIRNLLYHNPPTESEKALGLEQLSRYQHIMKFIDSVSLYNQREQKVYLSSSVNEYSNRIVPLSEYGDSGIVSIIREYRSYHAYAVIPRILARRDGTPQHYYTFFGYDFTDKAVNSDLLCAVVVNISTDWVRTLSEPSAADGRHVPGETLIIGSDGRVISHSEAWPMLSDLSSERFLEGVLEPDQHGRETARLADGSEVGTAMTAAGASSASQGSGGTRIAEVRGEKTLVVWTAPDGLGWRYVRLIPYSAVTSDIVRLRNGTLLIACVALLIALLFSVPLNRTLLSPIERIRQHVGELQSRQRESRLELRQALLRRILSGDLPEPGATLASELAENRIALGLEGCFQLALLKLDNHAQVVAENTPEDRKLLKFAILNIASEICSEHFHAEGVDLGDNRLVLLLNRAEDSGETDCMTNRACDGTEYDLNDRAAEGAENGARDNAAAPAKGTLSDERLRRIFRSVQAAIAHHLSLSVSIAASRTSSRFQEYPELLADASGRMIRRFFAGHGCVLLHDEACDDDAYIYPERKERALLDALNQGQQEKASELCREVLEEASHSSYHTFIITVSRLELFLNIVSRSLRQDRQSEAGDIFRIDIERMETMDELLDRFDGALHVLSARIAGKGRGRTQETVERIDIILGERYPDASLGIETIAQQLDLSDGYIGRIYRQATGLSILERLSELRMEKARSLLADSNGPVSSIAEQVGFSSESYFYKNFRKSHGVTPTEYRRQQRTRKPEEGSAEG